ncbi:MAG: ABC transporter permease [Methanomassiliicoccales archaeon]|nr:MAG: ABC transporter permease [Methanomassiliicoccales archaeon]
MKGILIGMFAIIRYSTKKILFSRKAIITILIALFIAVVMGYAATQDMDRLQAGTDFMDGLILFFFMPVIAMIYGASIIRNEIEDKSITQILTSPLKREYAYLGYYISLAISLSIVMVIIVTVGFLAFFGQKGIDGDALGVYVDICALSIIGSLVYSSLFLFISLPLKRPLYFGLFYAFIWEGFIGSLGGKIQEVALKHYIRSIGSEWIPFGVISDYSASEVTYSFLVMVVVTSVFLFLGMIIFRIKEFP